MAGIALLVVGGMFALGKWQEWRANQLFAEAQQLVQQGQEIEEKSYNKAKEYSQPPPPLENPVANWKSYIEALTHYETALKNARKITEDYPSTSAAIKLAQTGQKLGALTVSELEETILPKMQRRGLIFAVEEGDVGTVRDLLAKGVDPNAEVGWWRCEDDRCDYFESDGDGGRGTPLHIAAERGDAAVVNQLVKGGANVNAVDETDGVGELTPLLIAARLGHAGVVKVLLEAGVDANSKIHYCGLYSYCFPALGLALAGGHRDVVEMLLSAGANYGDGKNPVDPAMLVAAAEGGFADIVKRMLDAGASPDPDKRLAGSAGRGELMFEYWERTALIAAAEHGDTETLKLLLHAEANLDLVDPSDLTALGKALRDGNTEVAELLRKAGAKKVKREVSASGDKWTTIDDAEEVSVLKQKWAALQTKQKGEADRPGAAPPGAPSTAASPAESADIPGVNVGDTYVVESQYPQNAKLNNTTERKVISVVDGEITVTSRNVSSTTGRSRILRFTRDWNLVSSRNPDGSGLDYSPPLKYFEFPLNPGKTWRQTSIEKNIKTGATREFTLSATVGDWENVSVPAGKFRAIKITTQTALLDGASGQRSTGTDISWYAPDTRRSVKSLVTSRNMEGNAEEQFIQIVRYELK
ncbi:MAG: ankyrin repeat domain-containing protein [Gammaproteobacteria bacterium]